jgi:hypothetical protein
MNSIESVKRATGDGGRTSAHLPSVRHHSSSNGFDQTLYLIGRPTLKQYLRFVRSNVIDPPGDGFLTEEWERASNHARMLANDEAGYADNPPITPIDVQKYEPLLTEFLKDPLVQHGFNTLPSEVAVVELDRLVVYQHHIDLTYVQDLERMLGTGPSEERVFRACLLHDHPRPPVRWMKIRKDSVTFLSPSNDMRFLGTMKLRPDNI